MIEICRVYAYCKDDDISLIENYDKAVADTTQTWICHHRDEVKVLPSGMIVYRSKEELIENGRYYHCPANELIFVTKEEHNKLHFAGRHLSEERRRDISNRMKGHKCSDESRKKMSEVKKGKNHTEDTKRKISEALKGRTLSEDTRKKISESKKFYYKNKKLC